MLEEQGILGNHHIPKNATVSDYMYATAFEGLIGYLYLNKKDNRLKEILDIILDLDIKN